MIIMDSKEYGYGKEFNTRQLIGEGIIVATRDHNLEINGILKEFFERTEAIAVEKYSITIRKEDGTKDIVESGDMIFLRRDAWLTLRVKKLRGGK
jgi:hypothetical protein